MRLTPIDCNTLDQALVQFATYLAPDTAALAAFDLIAGTAVDYDAPYDSAAHRQAARDLVASFGVPVIDEEPSAAFSWDGGSRIAVAQKWAHLTPRKVNSAVSLSRTTVLCSTA